MKKVILTIAVLVGVSAANLSVASDKVKENSSIELVSTGELKFKLTLGNVTERSSVVIKDFGGDVVYSTSIPKSENYSKIFDLSNLSDGNYTFVISNGNEVSTKPFSISTETKRQVIAVVK
ncbi:hypothetical protein [Dyadobacter arcticus]|uniref:Por secretion system C-terminal sorting domain-containing protein n=1 Tax=Dyadobacter arcticus TaxID=1078754 RepID=A0ABX0ULD0_9BACT|nr:hypothetical protein [Dyadobacter arcticus]NIJ51921.1 hypothetical protein [Dyadobacter arcticus]